MTPENIHMQNHQIYVTYKDQVPLMSFPDDENSITVIIHHECFMGATFNGIVGNVKAQVREQKPKGTVIAIATRPTKQHKPITLDEAMDCVSRALERKGGHWMYWTFSSVSRDMNPSDVKAAIERDIERENKQ